PTVGIGQIARTVRGGMGMSPLCPPTPGAEPARRGAPNRPTPADGAPRPVLDARYAGRSDMLQRRRTLPPSPYLTGTSHVAHHCCLPAVSAAHRRRGMA